MRDILGEEILLPALTSAIAEAFRFHSHFNAATVKELYVVSQDAIMTEAGPRRDTIGVGTPFQEFIHYIRYNTGAFAERLFGLATPVIAASALGAHFLPFAHVGIVVGVAAVAAAAWFGLEPLKNAFYALMPADSTYEAIQRLGANIAHLGETSVVKPNLIQESDAPNKGIDPQLIVRDDLYRTDDGHVTKFHELFSVEGMNPAHFVDSTNAFVSTMAVRFTAPIISDRDQQKQWTPERTQELELPLFARWKGDIMDEAQLPELRNKWLEHVDPTKARLYSSSAASMDLEESQRKVEVMLKSGEVYFPEPGKEKGRVICNVRPAFQWHTGPYVYEATARIKTVFGFREDGLAHEGNIDADGTPYYLTYGSGASTYQLNLWKQIVDEDPVGNYVIAAGDDCVARIDGQWYCSDFSSFDTSEGNGPLGFERRCLKAVGVPDDILDALRNISEAPMVYHNRWLRKHSPGTPNSYIVKHANRPWRVTGGPDTTVGNTLVSLGAWGLILNRHLKGVKPLESSFASLGFKVKLNPCDEHKLIFLRGRWIHIVTAARAAWHWTPCLGKIAKCQKTKANLDLLFPGLALPEQIRQYKGQMACALVPYSWNPFWGALVGAWDAGVDTCVLDHFKFMAQEDDAPDATEEAVLDGLCLAYGDPDPSGTLGLTREELMRAISDVAGLESSHSLRSDVWVRLYRMDYA